MPLCCSCDLLQLIRMKGNGRMTINLDQPIELPSFRIKGSIQAVLFTFNDYSLGSNMKRFDYPDLGTNLKAHAFVLSLSLELSRMLVSLLLSRISSMGVSCLGGLREAMAPARRAASRIFTCSGVCFAICPRINQSLPCCRSFTL